MTQFRRDDALDVTEADGRRAGMALFDRLPASIRHELNYGPAPGNASSALWCVAAMGEAGALARVRAVMAEQWRKLGAEPLRP